MKKLERFRSTSTLRSVLTAVGFTMASGYATESRAQVAETLTFFADCKDQAKIHAEGTRLLGIKKGAEAPKFELLEGDIKCLAGGLVKVPIRPKAAKAEARVQTTESLTFFADCKDVARIRAEGARLLGIKKGADAPKFEVATGEAECMAGGLVKVPVKPKTNRLISFDASKNELVFETNDPSKREEQAVALAANQLGLSPLEFRQRYQFDPSQDIRQFIAGPAEGSKPWQFRWRPNPSYQGSRYSVGEAATIDLEPLPTLPTRKGQQSLDLEGPGHTALPGQSVGMLDPEGLPMTGDFTDEQVDRYIEQRQAAFTYCYPKNEGVSGEVSIKFTFGRNGKISKVAVQENTLKDRTGAKQDKRFVECAITAIKRWSLPPQSRVITRTLPFGF